MNHNTLAERIRKLQPELERAAAEVLGGRCYVARASTLPKPYSECGRRQLGWAGNCLDLALKQHLPWRGRGGCVVLGDAAVAKHMAALMTGRPGANTGRILENLVAGILGHELGHVVRSGWTFPELPPEAELSIKPAVETWAREVHPAANTTRVPWQGHDGAWLRTAQHAAARIGRRLGLAAVPVLATEAYNLSAGRRYAARLADELDQLAGVKLADVAETSPPRAFVELWTSDVRRWYQRLGEPSREQTEALVTGVTLFGGMNDGREETSRPTECAA